MSDERKRKLSPTLNDGADDPKRSKPLKITIKPPVAGAAPMDIVDVSDDDVQEDDEVQEIQEIQETGSLKVRIKSKDRATERAKDKDKDKAKKKKKDKAKKDKAKKDKAKKKKDKKKKKKKKKKKEKEKRKRRKERKRRRKDRARRRKAFQERELDRATAAAKGEPVPPSLDPVSSSSESSYYSSYSESSEYSPGSVSASETISDSAASQESGLDDGNEVGTGRAAAVAAKLPPSVAETTMFGARQLQGVGNFEDCAALALKVDAANRPIWVTANGHIYLESFSPLYKMAYDFLIAIAFPVCRARLIQEYRLNHTTLYAAVSLGLDANTITSVLSSLSKVEVPRVVIDGIHHAVRNYGKAKLVLRDTGYFVEATHRKVLETLLEDPKLARVAQDPEGGADRVALQGKSMSYAEAVAAAALKSAGLAPMDAQSVAPAADPHSAAALAARVIKEFVPGASSSFDDVIRGTATVDRDAGDAMVPEDDAAEVFGSGAANAAKRFYFEIPPEDVEFVKRQAIALNYPLLEEYDFRNDSHNVELDIHLKPMTSIRPYQEKALRKMFGNGRARSGIIVLPCGAGKTLVGITAATTVKRSTIVLCTSGVAVEQWKRQFQLWTSVDESIIIRFTNSAEDKHDLEDMVRRNDRNAPIILISTYSLMAYSGKRRKINQKIMDYVASREWGMMLLDEVHVAPANEFKKCAQLRAHCKLGLTATLVREDGRIDDLDYIIGPKLYEANWIDLQDAGYIARVQCAEVWCEMTPAFYREYIKASARHRKLLYVMNPNKFLATAFLIQYHEARGDKILIFSDNIFALRQYSEYLDKPMIYGDTPSNERMAILYQFQHNATLNVVCISKVGDNSIDLPGASVVIQIAAHYGSRRQEAQRLGRILRAKVNTDGGYNAFFYSVVSKDTQEMYYSSKRQQFLVDQGYSFKVITHLPTPGPHKLATPEGQKQLLMQVLAEDPEAGRTEHYDDEDPDWAGASRRTRRSTGSMSSLSAGSAANTVYAEMGYGSRARSRKKGSLPRSRAEAFKGTALAKIFERKKLSAEQKAKKAAERKAAARLARHLPSHYVE